MENCDESSRVTVRCPKPRVVKRTIRVEYDKRDTEHKLSGARVITTTVTELPDNDWVSEGDLLAWLALNDVEAFGQEVASGLSWDSEDTGFELVRSTR